MTFGTSMKLFAATTLFALASAPALGATVTFNGSVSTDWFTSGNWTWSSGGPGIPGSGDDAVVPFNKLAQISGGAAVASSLNVQVSGQAGGQVLILDGSLTVYGGATSTISALSGVKLDHANAVLVIPNTQTWSGTGSIDMSDAGADLQVDADGISETVVFTSYVDIIGHGNMVGLVDAGQSDVVTFENLGGVKAFGGNLVLNSDLGLDDTASVLWETSASADLVFQGPATTLAGDIKVAGGGLITVMADLTTTGSFLWQNGSIDIPGAHDFTYSDFSSACENPVGGSAPYTLSGPFEDPLTCTP